MPAGVCSMSIPRLISCLWNDEDGMILSSEVVLVGTILVIGSIAGLTSLQYAVTQELNDTAQAWDAWSPSGSQDGHSTSWTVHDSQGRREVACDGY